MVLCVCSATVPAAEVNCVPQRHVDVASISAPVVMVGEPHGTNEFPEFTRGLVCSLLKAGKSVILGIEHDGDEQAGLNKYLLSEGTAADQMELLSARAWQGKTQDGRTSKAMFDLIESMRRLRHAGQRVGILAIERNENLDVPTTPEELTFLSPQDNVIQSRGNDRTMADNIVYAAVLYRQYTVVVLSGHTYTTIGYPADKDFQPMGYLVAQQLPVFFIGFQTEGGTHWQTGPGGGRERPLPAGRLMEGSKADAIVNLGAITTSEPALLARKRP